MQIAAFYYIANVVKNIILNNFVSVITFCQVNLHFLSKFQEMIFVM